MGLSGVFFVVSGNLDRPGKLQTDHVRELANNGHRIGSHTVTHARLPELSEEDLRAELEVSKQDLEILLGQTVDWLAPPRGSLGRPSRGRRHESGVRSDTYHGMGLRGYAIEWTRTCIAGTSDISHGRIYTSH